MRVGRNPDRTRTWKARILTTASTVLCLSFVPGCWDMRELNNRALVISSAIDMTDDGRICLTDQFAIPSALGQQGAGDPKKRFYTLSETGDTVQEAAQVLQTRQPRYIFIGHRRNIFFGEPTARQGLAHLLDEFTRNPESRLRTDVAVVDGRPGSDALKVPSIVEKLPSIAALKSRSVVGGGQPGSAFVDFLIASDNETSCPTMPLVKIVEQPEDYVAGSPSAQIAFVGRAVFNTQLKMVGKIDYEETVYRFWEMGRLTHQTFSVRLPGKEHSVSVYVNHMKSKILPVIRGHHLYVTVKMDGDGSLNESDASMDYMKPEPVKTVEDALDKKVADSVQHLISRVQQEYHTDIFNFDGATHNRYPFLWPSLEKEWKDLFTDATITVQAHVHIRTVGQTGLPLHHVTV